MTSADELHDALDGQRNDLLTKVCDEINKIPQQPDEFSVAEIADQTNLKRKTVEYRLKKLEREGVLTSRRPGRIRYYRYV